jgi:hypothetical protein
LSASRASEDELEMTFAVEVFEEDNLKVLGEDEIFIAVVIKID